MGFSGRGVVAVWVGRAAWSAVLLVGQGSVVVRADAFSEYVIGGSFELPSGASGLDLLPDGRLVTVVGTEIYLEEAVAARTFAPLGPLAGADFSSFGVSFLAVSPDGTTLAVGNGGGATFDHYQVGVFSVAGLTGAWFDVVHYSAAWFDNRHLAVAGGQFGSPGFVSLLDTQSPDPMNPVNPMIVENVGGASGGIAFDENSNLYTGNGFASTGPSGTGAIMFFDQASWNAVLSGGMPLDFEVEGLLVAEVLSADSLGFDAEGHLHIGGGDFGSGDSNTAALAHADAVLEAIGGGAPVDVMNPAELRRFDPDAGNPFNFYSVRANPVTAELYIREGVTVYAYEVPAGAPTAPPVPHDVPKNRYVSFAPNSAGRAVAFRVTRTAPGAPMDLGWAGAPGALNRATISPTPVTRVWTEPEIHVYSCAIVPIAEYEIRSTTGGAVFSAPYVVETIEQPAPKFWADSVGEIVMNEWTGPNQLVNVNDVVAAIQFFQGSATAPHLTWVDMEPACANGVVNFTDVLQIVRGFQGNEYPFTSDPACTEACAAP